LDGERKKLRADIMGLEAMCRRQKNSTGKRDKGDAGKPFRKKTFPQNTATYGGGRTKGKGDGGSDQWPAKFNLKRLLKK